MNDNEDTIRQEAPTRREYVKYGGAIVGAGLLAGCAGDGGGDSPETDTSTPTETATKTGTATGTETAESEAAETTETGANTPYEVCIEPVGCQTFESVPETYIVYNGGWADMAFALGQREGFLTAGNMIPGFFFDPFGLDVPPESELPSMWDGGWDKEMFYELDPDVFLADPNFFEIADGWDESDSKEIADNVAPWFGSNSRRRREFHDYKLYTLYECLEKCAELFKQRERYEALVEVHEDLQQTIQSRLPGGKSPIIGLINGGSNPTKGEFFPLNPRDEGYEMKPYRDLNVRSAFPGRMEGGETDYEGLLEVDPEVIMVHWGIGTVSEDADGFAAETFREQYVTPMEEHPVGQQLTAVKNDAVYPGQYGEQGPLTNLLQTEMVAQQLYPDEFGAFDPEAFPEVSEENQLFDRQRVRDIIAGDL